MPLQLHCVLCLTWQYTYSLTRHCRSTASIQSLPHVAVHLLSQVPLQLHCITAGTSSRGSALTLARATAATLQSLPLSRATASTLCSLPHVAVHLLSQGHCICTLPLGPAHYFSLYIYTKCKPCFWWPAGHFFEKKNSEKKNCSEYVFCDLEQIIFLAIFLVKCRCRESNRGRPASKWNPFTNWTTQRTLLSQPVCRIAGLCTRTFFCQRCSKIWEIRLF